MPIMPYVLPWIARSYPYKSELTYAFKALISIGKLDHPEDSVDTVLLFASDASGFTTRQAPFIDGGTAA